MDLKNTEVTGKAVFDSTLTAGTTAKMKTGGGSLLSAKVSAAIAYGRASSMISVNVTGKGDFGSVSATNTAEDIVKADISNQSIDIISAAARFGAAYSNDLFTTNVIMSGPTTEIKGDVDVNTNYNITTTAGVTPSAGGVKISLADVSVNAAIAKDTGTANAAFEAIKGTAHVAGNVNVKTSGTSSTEAEVRTAKITVGGVSLGANIANSDMSLTQESHLRVGGTLTVDGGVDVQSVANSAFAKATIATSGTDSGLKLGLANLDISRAVSRENMTSSASVVGGPVSTAMDVQKIDKGQYVTKTVERYDYEVQVDGLYTVRDDNGVVQKETVKIEQWNTGEYKLWNAEGDLVINTLKDENADKRTKSRTITQKNYDKLRIGPHYEWITEEVTEWEKNIVDEEYEVDVYNPDQNILSAASLNIFSGTEGNTKTGSTARTNGPLTVGLVTAGSMDSQAYSTDSFSVVFEGMTATITGKATLKAATNTVAKAEGATPGGASLVDSSSSTVTAQVGKREDKQYTGVLIGKGNSLIAESIDISTDNRGEASAWLDQGTQFSLGKIKKSSQPTDSFYNTLISVGRGATLKATGGDITITSSDAPNASSKVNTSNYSLTLNFNSMMGQNNIDQENNLDIGANAKVTASGNITLQTTQRTLADAETTMNGGSVLEGSTAVAKNKIYRVARVNIGEDAAITAGEEGNLTIKSFSGDNDDIHTRAYVGSKGVIALGNAKAYATVETHAEIVIAQGAKLTAPAGLTLDAHATSFNPQNDRKAGIRTEGIVESGALIPMPNTVAKNDLKFYAYIDINQDRSEGAVKNRKKVQLTSESGDVMINSSNEGMSILANARSIGKGGGGISNANAWNAADLTNFVWIDDTALTGKNITVYADNGGTLKGNTAKKAYIRSESYAELTAVAGKVQPDSRITGVMRNQILSNNVGNVTWTANGGTVIHKTSDPQKAINVDAITDYDRVEVMGISLTKAKEISIIKWYVHNRCDFCNEGERDVIDRTVQEALDKRYDDAFEKALAPINDIQREISNRGAISKARYAEEDATAASKIFVLDIKSILERDVRIDPNRVKAYKLWTNTETYLNVYLMPNAARLYTNGTDRLQYAVDLVRGDLFGDGNILDIEIMTALTRNAFANPVIPIGSTGSLDLGTGMLTLPDKADYELYLHEISGSWLLSNMNDGFIRAMIADPEEINACALEGKQLPQGEIADFLIADEGKDGNQVYWFGKTPEEADDPDMVFICLLYNPETDEVDAFRTTPRMIGNGEDPIDVSLYLYRDSKSDRMGEEKYNAMFFDTPAEEKSLVKVVTNTLSVRNLETPLPLRIVLRGQYLEGADKPVYCLTDHAFILCDGTDGIVDILGGYQATFDGDTFDSNYTKIEGIRNNNLVVTIKEGQPVWPEWKSEDAAEDIGGTRFQKDGDEWVQIPDDETVQAEEENDGAA